MTKRFSKLIKSISLLIVVSMCFLLTGCQETPSEAAIINKGDNHFQEKVQATAAPDVSASEDMEEIQSWSDQIDLGNTQVKVDAQVNIPSYEAVSVNEIEQVYFDQSRVDSLLQYFIGDAATYQVTSQMTKVQCETMIVELKKELSQWQNFDSLSSSEKTALDNGNSPEEEISRLQDQIKYYEGLYQKSSDDADLQETKIDIGTIKDYRVVDAMANLNRENPAKIRVGNVEGNGAIFMFSNFTNADDNGDSEVSDEQLSALKGLIELSEDDAKQKAQKVVEDLKIENVRVLKVNLYSQVVDGKKSAYYDVVFEKAIVGLPIRNDIMGASGMQTDTASDNQSDELYSQPISNEILSIKVDDTGIIGFLWSSPNRITEEINDNSKVINLDDAKELFRKNIGFKAWSDGIQENIIEIDDVTFSLMLIRKKDAISTYLAVPVWDFLGTLYLKDATESDINHAKNIMPGMKTSYLTINAIDGSVIDREKGY